MQQRLTLDEAIRLALGHHQAGRLAQAEQIYRQILAADPNCAAALHPLGVLQHQIGQSEAGVQMIERAIQLGAGDEARNNLAEILRLLERYEKTVEVLEPLLAQRPGDARAARTLYRVYHQLRQRDAALATIDRALSSGAKEPEVHLDRAFALLALGRYAEGFKEYEWRWLCKGFLAGVPQDGGRPRWDGSDLTGRTILVHGEQGHGDVIQFARFLPMLCPRAARIYVQVEPPLVRLFENIPGIARVFPRGTPVAEFDLHVPLLSLARIFGATVETIPVEIPYLRARASHLEKWRGMVGQHEQGLKVGLVWAGGMQAAQGRSVSLNDLAPLAEVSGVRWFSLQTGEGRTQIADAPAGLKLIDLGKGLGDFADTAAAMSAMDLVISIDTASAHLGGALGVPTWTLLGYAPDWRWSLKDETTPWYPAMRLFRQQRRNDWAGVVERVRQELELLVQTCQH